MKKELLICAQQCLKDKEGCSATKCRYFIDYEDDYNCCLVSVHEHGPLTLREIAKREGLSFARVKQIEKKALFIMRKKLADDV